MKLLCKAFVFLIYFPLACITYVLCFPLAVAFDEKELLDSPLDLLDIFND